MIEKPSSFSIFFLTPAQTNKLICADGDRGDLCNETELNRLIDKLGDETLSLEEIVSENQLSRGTVRR